MTGVFRLLMDSPIDGTAMCCLMYICWRHNFKQGHARPGIDRIASDLGLKPRTVIAAMKRLDNSHLIVKEKGSGRGRTTRYKLPWLQLHLIDPSSTDPIPWKPGRRGAKSSEKVQQDAPFHPERVHHSVEKGATGCTLPSTKGASERHKGYIPASEKVQQDAPEKNKRLKGDQDQIDLPISDSERHEISTACVKAGVGDCDWVDIKMQAINLGHDISNYDLQQIHHEIRNLRQGKSQGAIR